MAIAFKDYYETLGVSRDATPEQIQAAYRKQARKYHPDVNRAPDAEERFKLINEAGEVLRDPEKRRKYDALGADWRNGQEFTPPDAGRTNQDDGAEAFHFGEAVDFSDFFSSLFGQGGASQGRARWSARGDDIESELSVAIEDVAQGATRSVTLRVPEADAKGDLRYVSRSFDVHIPKGVPDGALLRLAGQGEPGFSGGESGDLFIRVRYAPHPRFRVEGRDLVTDVPVAPWEAALGGAIPVPTLDGVVQAKLPAGTGSGKRLRLRGQGLPDRAGSRGDLFAALRIDVPKTLDDRERELFEALQRESKFDPRARG